MADFNGWRLQITHLFPKGWDVWLPVEPSSSPMLGRYFSAEVVGDDSFRRNVARDLLRLCDLDEIEWGEMYAYLHCEDGRAWKMHGLWPLKIDVLPGPLSEGGTRLSIGFNFKRVLEYGWEGGE